MAERVKTKSISNSYTQRERQELTRELNKVLNKCPDKTFGRAVAAAAREIRSSK